MDSTKLATAVANTQQELVDIGLAKAAALAILLAAESGSPLDGPDIVDTGAGGSFTMSRVAYLAELRQRVSALAAAEKTISETLNIQLTTLQNLNPLWQRTPIRGFR